MEEYKKIISQIESDIESDTRVTIAKDTDLYEATSNEASSSEYGGQYDRRDRLYSDLLEQYIEISRSKARWNEIYKLFYFFIAMGAFLALTISPIIVFQNISQKECTSIADIATVIGSITGIISAIIVIPEIIAKHLFPTNEDEHMIEMVKNMQINDSRIRTFRKNKEQKKK